MICQCVIAKLVVSRFPKDRNIRKQWVFVVKRKTKRGSQALSLGNDDDVVCQRHLTNSDFRPIKPFWRVTLIS